MGVFEYSRGVEWQGWGGVLLIFAVATAIAWVIAVVLDPGSAGEMWPFLALAVFLAVLGFAFRIHGRNEEREAEGPDVPD